MDGADAAVSDLIVQRHAGGPATRRPVRSPRFWTLPPFLRVLLITDGTVTQSLEAYFGEPIDVDVLAHVEIASHRHYTAINVNPGDSILRRRVLLRGQLTGTAYTFAESVVVLSRLSEKMRFTLMEGRIGIGEMLRDCRLETYREILAVRCAQAGAWARELGTDETASVVIRTYAIHVAAQPCIEIEEMFPEAPFRR